MNNDKYKLSDFVEHLKMLLNQFHKGRQQRKDKEIREISRKTIPAWNSNKERQSNHPHPMFVKLKYECSSIFSLSNNVNTASLIFPVLS